MFKITNSATSCLKGPENISKGSTGSGYSGYLPPHLFSRTQLKPAYSLMWKENRDKEMKNEGVNEGDKDRTQEGVAELF